MQKESAAAQEEMRRVREEINRNEERFRQLSDKVEKNTMTDAEMAAELRGLQAGREEKRQQCFAKQVTAVWRPCGNKLLPCVLQWSEPGRCCGPGINEGTPASSLELDLPRVRGALGECGGAGKKVHQGIAEEVYPTLQLDLRWKKMHCYENYES